MITVTDSAKKHIAALLAERETPAVGIRVGLRTAGCSGMSYTIEYADTVAEFDEVIEVKDVGQPFKIMLDPKAVMFLIGTEMDFQETKLESGFTFKNPNEKGRCGCGESFHV